MRNRNRLRNVFKKAHKPKSTTISSPKEIFTKQELIDRANDLPRENIKILYGIVKVIGLTTATIVLLNLLCKEPNLFHFSVIFQGVNVAKDSIYNWWGNDENLIFSLRIIFWITSGALTILTYDAAMFATIFLRRTAHPSVTIIIFVFMVLEFFLYAVLFPDFFLEKSVISENVIEKDSGFLVVVNTWSLHTLNLCFLHNGY